MLVWKLNLRHLRAFAETSRLGSISAAAQAVHLTQPAITQALAKLESILELSLFDRQSNVMIPKPAALLFAPRVITALAYINSQRVTMTQVHALISLAQHGSYVAASSATRLSQPALHRAVQDTALALGKTPLEALMWAPVNPMSVAQFIGAQEGLLNREQLEWWLTRGPEEYKVKEI